MDEVDNPLGSVFFHVSKLPNFEGGPFGIGPTILERLEGVNPNSTANDFMLKRYTEAKTEILQLTKDNPIILVNGILTDD